MWLAVLVLLLALHDAPQAAAIQVAPNSPCASLCVDDSSLDTSDPNSSNTDSADLSCLDESFSSTAAGKKWSSCMGCLQNSTFVQGPESDQAWFFYNLRYNFDYCIFGYPNGSNVASSPCQTSTACGLLLDSFTKGIPDMGSESEFSYCDGTNLTNDAFSACMSCISASSSSNILTNSLIALQAGCQQQLPGNEAVGLSGPVVAATSIINIVSPITSSSSSSSGTGTAGGTSHRVATTTIAIIVVVALLVVAAISGFAVVCCHKRRRAQGRRRAGQDGGGAAEKTAGAGRGGGGGGSGGIGPVQWASSIETITSPLSFQCRADRTSFASAATVASPQEQQQQHLQQQQQQQQQAVPGATAYLPAIAESPFPSPAPSAAGATTASSPTQQVPPPPTRPAATALPRLYQLKTSFGPPTSARGTGTGTGTGSSSLRYDSSNSASSATPTSATALLSHPAALALSRHGSPASASTLTLTTPSPLSALSSLASAGGDGGRAPYVPLAYIPGSSGLHPPPSMSPQQQQQQQQQQRFHQVAGASSSSPPMGYMPAWPSTTTAAAAQQPPPRQKHSRASNDYGSPVDSRPTRTVFPPPPQQRRR